MTRIMVIPDTQVKPDVPIDHMEWAAKYACEQKPDVIVHIGDHWDMPSLSSYDRKKKSFEGRRYAKDIEAGNEAIKLFERTIHKYNRRKRKKAYNPRKVFLVGNHEQRIERYVEDIPELEGMIGYHDFALDGWEVYEFLEVVVIEGVAFSHYFTSGVRGYPVTSANLMLQKQHMSTVMGHHQQRDISFAKRADGKRMTGLFVGTFYQHDEKYLGPQGNSQWRGLWMLNEVDDGAFDEMPVSMSYLRGKYAQ